MINWHRRQEFGLTLKQVIREIACSRRDKRRVLLNSIPKAGTNLLLRVVSQLDGYSRLPIRTPICDSKALRGVLSFTPKGRYITAHLEFSCDLEEWLIEHDFLIFVVVRRPLDVVLSNVRYITAIDKGHRLHPYLASKLTSDRDRFLAILDGISARELGGLSPSLSVYERFENFSGWASSKAAHLVTYEQLVGEKGGGDADAQLAATSDILNIIGNGSDNIDFTSVASHLFSEKSRTFSKGTIGRGQHFVEQNMLQNEVDWRRLGDIEKCFGYSAR